MLQLVVNPDSPQAWSIELQPGIVSLGRSETNDVLIEHASVSSSHCQISVGEPGVWIKDLGSTAGTFVDGELVEQAKLKPGQLIRLGEVALRFESDAPATSAAPPMAPPLPVRPSVLTASGARGFCKYHPRVASRYSCPKCRLAFCELCVTTRLVHGGVTRLCRSCGSECQPVQQSIESPEPAPGFARSLPGALLYPFQGSGVLMLVAGTAFFFLLGWVPLLGLVVTGYMFSYAKSIITSTAEGRTDLPDWPDFSDWKDDILMPYLQLLALLVLFFGPAVIVAAWHPGTDIQTGIAFLAALAFGALLAPMGILALAMFDTITSLNPIALVWSILRVPGHYFVAAAIFELILLIYWFVAGALEMLIPIPLVPGLISSFVYLYLVAVGMRVLGLLYRARKDDLGWFRQNALRSV